MGSKEDGQEFEQGGIVALVSLFYNANDSSSFCSWPAIAFAHAPKHRSAFPSAALGELQWTNGKHRCFVGFQVRCELIARRIIQSSSR